MSPVLLLSLISCLVAPAFAYPQYPERRLQRFGDAKQHCAYSLQFLFRSVRHQRSEIHDPSQHTGLTFSNYT